MSEYMFGMLMIGGTTIFMACMMISLNDWWNRWSVAGVVLWAIIWLAPPLAKIWILGVMG